MKILLWEVSILQELNFLKPFPYEYGPEHLSYAGCGLMYGVSAVFVKSNSFFMCAFLYLLSIELFGEVKGNCIGVELLVLG